jgi:hypothetical protein
MKIVNLTLRSALDDFAPRPIEENNFETQVRCMSTKIPINSNEREIQLIQQRICGILTVPYELLK